MDTTNRFCRAIDKVIAALEKIIYPLSKGLNIIGVMTIMAVTCFIVADVLLRKLFNSPITGGYEIVQYGMVIIVYLALPFTQMEKGHVAVNMLVDTLPPRLQQIIEVFTNLISIGFWGAITYAGLQQAVAQFNKNVVSATLRIPAYPIVYILTVGTAFLVLVLIIDFLRSLRGSALPKAYYAGLKDANEPFNK